MSSAYRTRCPSINGDRLELDHLFICVGPGALAAEALRAFGLVEGSSNRHPGQGTANRRFFFRNAFLELLFLTDPREVRSTLTAPTRLYERFKAATDGPGAVGDTSSGEPSTEKASFPVSPFGVCFRPTTPDEKRATFPSLRYRPAYLPQELWIEIGKAPLTEPMWFFARFFDRPDRMAGGRRQPLAHPLGVQEITAVRILIPRETALSLAALEAQAVPGIEVARGDVPLMTLVFDGASGGRLKDFRPELPLAIRW
jgi:hypothetical protein